MNFHAPVLVPIGVAVVRIEGPVFPKPLPRDLNGVETQTDERFHDLRGPIHGELPVGRIAPVMDRFIVGVPLDFYQKMGMRGGQRCHLFQNGSGGIFKLGLTRIEDDRFRKNQEEMIGPAGDRYLPPPVFIIQGRTQVPFERSENPSGLLPFRRRGLFVPADFFGVRPPPRPAVSGNRILRFSAEASTQKGERKTPSAAEGDRSGSAAKDRSPAPAERASPPRVGIGAPSASGGAAPGEPLAGTRKSTAPS